MMACPVDDGAACAILAHPDVVRSKQPGRPLVRVRASTLQSETYSPGHTFLGPVVGPPSMTRDAANAAYEASAIGPEEVSLALVHDAFADRLMMWHTFNQPLGVMAAAVSLCAGGVLERFPRLRVALLEGNCSWAPWLMHRLDEHYEWVGWYEARDLSKKPSEYFRENCFVSVEVDEATVTHCRDWFGDDNLVVSTDFPHGDSQYPHAIEAFRKLPLSEESQRKIVGENWSRLYDVPLARRRAR